MWIEQLQPLSDDVCLAPGDPGRWLSAAERDRLARIRSPQRRTGWLAGRRLAKELLCSVDGRTSPGPAGWHIESRDGRGRPAPPRAFRCGRLVPWVVSISHSDRSVYVAVSTARGVRLGVDVTPVRPLSDSFARLWLTDNERRWCARDATGLLRCLVWSVKESCYKAAGNGSPFRPRQIDCMTATNLGAPAIQRAVRPRPCATDRRWAFHGRLPHCWR